MDLEAIKAAVAAWGAGKPLVKRVFIFGSRARGDHRPDSDLDVAAELDPVEIEGEDDSGGAATWMWEAQGWRGELQALFPFPVQLEQYLENGDAPTVLSGVERSSILVYEKQ